MGISSVGVKVGVNVGEYMISGDGEAVAVRVGWGVRITVASGVGGNMVGVKETADSGAVVWSDVSLALIAREGEQALNKSTNPARIEWR
ncbi:MAG: hypothetical protein H6650_13770 [Ardenticatenales bacterium]|nr:hypothetical protein [Ardenticatenales bacterium]